MPKSASARCSSWSAWCEATAGKATPTSAPAASGRRYGFERSGDPRVVAHAGLPGEPLHLYGATEALRSRHGVHGDPFRKGSAEGGGRLRADDSVGRNPAPAERQQPRRACARRSRRPRSRLRIRAHWAPAEPHARPFRAPQSEPARRWRRCRRRERRRAPLALWLWRLRRCGPGRFADPDEEPENDRCNDAEKDSGGAEGSGVDAANRTSPRRHANGRLRDGRLGDPWKRATWQVPREIVVPDEPAEDGSVTQAVP